MRRSLSKKNVPVFMLASAAALTAAASARASPLIDVSILGNTNGGSTYSSNLTGVTAGEKVYYEVVAEIAAPGVLNSNKSLVTAAQVNGSDGIGGIALNLTDSSGELTSAGVLQSGYGAGTGTTAGTASGGSISGIFELLGVGAPYLGGTTPVQMYTGAFVAGSAASDTLSGSLDYPPGFNAKINTTAGQKALTASSQGTDPYVGFSSLTILESSSNFTWTGNAGDQNWFTAGNWLPNGTPGAGDTATVADGSTANINSNLNDSNGTILATGAGSTISIGSGGVITGGSLTTANGGIIEGAGGTLSNLANAGEVLTSNNSLSLQGNIDNSGLIQFNGGTLNINSNASLSGAGSVLLSNGNIQGSSTSLLSNSSNLIHGYGSVSVPMTNVGTITADSTGQTLSLNGYAIANSGTMGAANGGTLAINTAVTGSGTILARGGTVNENANVTESLINSVGGAFNLQSGTLTVATITGSLNQSGGILTPGSAPAVTTVSGDYIQTGGSLQMNLSDVNYVESWNLLEISGNATLDGTLSLQPSLYFDPLQYDSFDIAHIAGTRTGSWGLTEGQTVDLGVNPMQITFEGGPDHKSIVLYTGTNPSDVPIATAATGAPASVSGTYSTPNTGASYTYGSIDILPGASYTLQSNDSLNLTNGSDGVLVAPGATFTENGTLNGWIYNQGTVHLSPYQMSILSKTRGGYVSIPSPVPNQTVSALGGITINSEVGFGGGIIDGGGYAASPQVLPSSYVENNGNTHCPRASAASGPGAPSYDASLEITGGYYASGGNTRLYIAGSQKGITYSTLYVDQSVEINGGLQIVLEPQLFGFVPSLGEKFDLIESPVGIDLDTLAATNFVTPAGTSYFPGISTQGFNSGYTDDPDNLLALDASLFTYNVVTENGEYVLQATYVVPEPSSTALLVAGAGTLALRRRRRR